MQNFRVIGFPEQKLEGGDENIPLPQF